MGNHPPVVEARKSAAFRLEVVAAITAVVVSSGRHLVAAAEETAPKAEEKLPLAVAVKGTQKKVAEREEEVKEQAAEAEVVVVMEPKEGEMVQAVVAVGTVSDAVSDVVSDAVMNAVVGKGEKGYPVKVK